MVCNKPYLIGNSTLYCVVKLQKKCYCVNCPYMIVLCYEIMKMLLFELFLYKKIYIKK